MDLKFKRYSNSSESELNALFFDSIFKYRSEYEYVKEHKWIDRYKNETSSIQLLATAGKKLVASVGVLPIETRIGSKIYKGGCFVDNCISTKLTAERSEITFCIFNELEKLMINKKYDFLIGWDYLKNKSNYSQLIKENDYLSKEGVNWISGGFEHIKNSPVKWRAGKTLLIEFILMKLYNKVKLTLIKDYKDIKVRLVKKSDYAQISKLIHLCYPNDLILNYTKNVFLDLSSKYLMGGIILEKKGKILAAAPFQIGSWSGWMYGNPSLTDDWEIFNTILPETIAIDPKFMDTSIPELLSATLIKESQKNSLAQTHGFVTDVFDTNIAWRKKAHIKAGYLEPDIDLGMYMLKTFNKKLEVDKNQVWHIPPRNIISPLLK